ncbi:MAG: SpoIIE family protein phosphatase [Blastocatellales bacterium]
MTNKIRPVSGAAFFTLMFAHLVLLFFAPYFGSYDGWTARMQRESAEITSVDEKGPATDLRRGDEIVAINGIKPKDYPQILNLSRRIRSGTSYTMTVRRQGQLLNFNLHTVRHRVGILLTNSILSFINLLFLITGLVIFLLKPADKQAWMMALMFGTYTALINNGMIEGLPEWLLNVFRLAKLVGLFFLPVFVHFFAIFPVRSPLLKRFPKLLYFVYALFLFFVFPVFSPERLPNSIRDWLKGLWIYHQQWFGASGMILAVGMMFFGLLLLALNYKVGDPNDRRRLRVLMVGSVAGFFNLALMPMGEFFGLSLIFPKTWMYLDRALILTLPLIPISFAYAIIRHQVIPVSLMIRRGVRYVLVSRGSILIEAVVVILAVTAVLTYVFSLFKPSGLVIGMVSAAVAIVIWKLETRVHEKYLAPIIDRKFFRESYNSHQIIADLTNSLRSTTSLPQLSELVATKIQSALKTENVTIFLRDRQSGDFLSGYSCEYNSSDGLAVVCDRPSRLPQYSAIIETLADAGHPVDIEDGIPAFVRNNGYAASDTERQTLKEIKSALLMPLATSDGVIGMISLGPRLGDLPYSRDDKQMLMSVAGPATFAIENARLVERMIEEARLREEIEAENQQRAKELEEARQLQLSMLPKQVPQLPNLEIAAYMKTATEVGGDYYDFHLSDNGQLTIVVGDATGHGLKAGTVVTATKSLFNHLAETPDVTELFHHSSRALKLMNMRSLFMAMTIARISGDTLTLSSAGMPPVLIYRAKSGEVEEVKLTGIPLGSVTSYRYRQQQFKLSTGDVVVLMSDGFPERFNAAGEMIGYEQAKRSLAESASESAQSIIERYIRDAEVWADGYPQDDDVTFVVVKIRQS